MSKPIVKVKDKEYSVVNISVVLKINSGPLIYLRLAEKLDGTEYKLSNEETFKKEFIQYIFQEEEGEFKWAGTTIKFILVGYNSLESRIFELVGLVVKKDLTQWFNENNFKDKKQDYLIYQIIKGKNSWPFFNKVLGDKFEQPNQDFVEKLKLLFPDNCCIWRYRDSTNFHFLNKSIAFASRHLPQVQGWSAFDSDKPLRLILFEETKKNQTIPQLDKTWNPSYRFLPNRYSWNRWLDTSYTLSRGLSIKNGQEIALIKQLVTDGSNGEDTKKGHNFQEKNPTRLLFVPGTINIGDKNIFCHTITYEFPLPVFGDNENTQSVTIKIEVHYPERQIGDNEIISLRLAGNFKKWDKEKDEETQVKIAPGNNNWAIIDENNQSIKSGDDAVLYSHILSPTYSDKKYSGIYIKHEKDDEMIVDVNPCVIPLVVGSVQKYRKELEQADVTLSGEKLAISISSHYQSLDKSEAIVLDNSEIKLNHGKKIFAKAQQKVDFLSQSFEIGSSQVNISSAKTQINSLVNISFPSPKFPTPNIPAAGVPKGTQGDVNKRTRNTNNSQGATNESASSGSLSRKAKGKTPLYKEDQAISNYMGVTGNIAIRDTLSPEEIELWSDNPPTRDELPKNYKGMNKPKLRGGGKSKKIDMDELNNAMGTKEELQQFIKDKIAPAFKDAKTYTENAGLKEDKEELINHAKELNNKDTMWAAVFPIAEKINQVVDKQNHHESKQGTGEGSSSSTEATFPHKGKHKPSKNCFDKNSQLIPKQLQRETENGNPAKYNTANAQTVRKWEQEARDNGYLLDDNFTVIHRFDFEIGADQGQMTNCIRIDGNHGHPIVEDKPGCKTSYNAYLKKVQKNNNATASSSEVAGAASSSGTAGTASSSRDAEREKSLKDIRERRKQRRKPDFEDKT